MKKVESKWEVPAPLKMVAATRQMTMVQLTIIRLVLHRKGLYGLWLFTEFTDLQVLSKTFHSNHAWAVRPGPDLLAVLRPGL